MQTKELNLKFHLHTCSFTQKFENCFLLQKKRKVQKKSEMSQTHEFVARARYQYLQKSWILLAVDCFILNNKTESLIPFLSDLIYERFNPTIDEEDTDAWKKRR